MTFGSICFGIQYFERAGCVINAHFATSEAMRAVGRAPSGAIPLTATRPVDLCNGTARAKCVHPPAAGESNVTLIWRAMRRLPSKVTSPCMPSTNSPEPPMMMGICGV